MSAQFELRSLNNSATIFKNPMNQMAVKYMGQIINASL